MRIVLFLDLDDTIFQTEPKCPAGEPVRPVAHRRDGTPLSFMTERQRALLDLLFRAATVIPTTARNLDAFRRVDLPFHHVAILDFGGVVLLPDGTLDKSWDSQVRPRARELARELTTHHQAIERFIAEQRLGAYARVIADFDMPLYLVIKHPDGDCSKLQPIREKLAVTADAELFFVHCNDNNLALVPRFLGKERAVQHVLERHLGPEPVLTLGLGDSLSDAPFLDLCDYSLLPRACQLARHRFAKP
jgi:hypothetical protein